VFALPVLKLLSNVKVKTASEGNERSKPSMFQGLGPLLNLLGGGSLTKLLLFLLKGLFG
jgi:hypothetical protein